MRACYALVPLAGLMLSTAAAAQSPELLRCAAVADNEARLACYDKAVAGMSTEARAISERRATETARLQREKAEADRRAAEAARAAAEAKRRAEFGDLRAQQDEATKIDIRQIETGIDEVFNTQTGLAVFLLENGQLWRQETAQSLPIVRKGDKVIIKKGLLGSFNMTLVGKNRTFTVIRRK